MARKKRRSLDDQNGSNRSSSSRQLWQLWTTYSVILLQPGVSDSIPVVRLTTARLLLGAVTASSRQVADTRAANKCSTAGAETKSGLLDTGNVALFRSTTDESTAFVQGQFREALLVSCRYSH